MQQRINKIELGNLNDAKKVELGLLMINICVIILLFVCGTYHKFKKYIKCAHD